MNFAETSLERYRAKLTGGRRASSRRASSRCAITPRPCRSRARSWSTTAPALACHKLGDEGRRHRAGPDASKACSRTRHGSIEHFRNPRAAMPDSIMPTFRFTDDDFKAMTAYLAGLKTAADAAHRRSETYKALCQRCHGEKGDGHGPIAIYLDPYPRDLTKAGFMNSQAAGAARSTRSRTASPARRCRPGARCSTTQQVKGVLEYVLSHFTKETRRELKPRKVPETNPVAMSAESVDARRSRLFVQRCAGCHGRKADGKGPNSLDILPRPRNLRNSCVRGQRQRPAPVRVDSVRRAGHGHAVVDRLRSVQERRRRPGEFHSQHQSEAAEE